jgi:hypothetical protein
MKKMFLVFILISIPLFSVLSQASSISHAQSMFIYNFSRLIQWPAGSNTGEFIIGVIGDNDVYSSLTAFVANKKVGTQSIVVKKFEDPQSISRCQILFIGDSKIARFPEVINKIQGYNSLLITEKKGMINSGSAIDFILVEDKLKFVLNTENAAKYNLTVSKSLEDMAYKN